MSSSQATSKAAAPSQMMWSAEEEMAWYTQKVEADNAAKLKIKLELDEADRVSQVQELSRPYRLIRSLDPNDQLYGTVTTPPPPSTPPSPTSSPLMVLHDTRFIVKPAPKYFQVEEEDKENVDIDEMKNSLSLPPSPVFKTMRKNSSNTDRLTPGIQRLSSLNTQAIMQELLPTPSSLINLTDCNDQQDSQNSPPTITPEEFAAAVFTPEEELYTCEELSVMVDKALVSVSDQEDSQELCPQELAAGEPQPVLQPPPPHQVDATGIADQTIVKDSISNKDMEVVR